MHRSRFAGLVNRVALRTIRNRATRLTLERLSSGGRIGRFELGASDRVMGYRLSAIEELEGRTLLSNTLTAFPAGDVERIISPTGDNSVAIYLTVQNGELAYSSDGTTYTRIPDLIAPFNVQAITGGTVTLSNFTDGLTLTAQQGFEHAPTELWNGPEGTVKITGTNVTDGQPFSVTSGTITVDPNTVVSTSSSSTAGKVSLSGETIVVGAGASLLAQGGTPAGDGTIALEATHANLPATPGPPGATNKVGAALAAFQDIYAAFQIATDAATTAKVTIGSSVVIHGGNTTISAAAGDIKYNDILNLLGYSVPGLGSQITGPLNDLFNSIGTGFPIAIAYKNSDASVDIGANASIISSGSVNVSADGESNALANAIFFKNGASYGFTFGVNIVGNTATTTLESGASINAAGSVNFTSSATSTSSVVSSTGQNTGLGMGSSAQIAGNSSLSPTNPNAIGISLAGGSVDTTSLATVNKGASITAGGNVLVQATGTDTNKTTVNAASYRDGTASVTASAAFTNANVKAYVDGSISAGGAGLGTAQTFNPFKTVNFATSSLVFTQSPGYATGEALVYSSGYGGAIPNLTSGTTYYAIVSASNPASIQLATTLQNALNGIAISFGAGYPTLTLPDGTVIPFDNVNGAYASQTSANGIAANPQPDPNSNTIAFDYDPGFTQGGQVTYTPAPGQFLGYDDANGNLLGALPAGKYTVNIVNATASDSNLYRIQLKNTDGTVVYLDDSPVFQTAAGVYVRVSSFSDNTGNNTVSFFPRDVTTPFTAAQPLKYFQGLATTVSGLSDQTTYYTIPDAADSAAAGSGVGNVVQLALSANDAQSVYGAVTAPTPTLSWTVNGSNHSVAIDDVDLANPKQSFLVFANSPNIPDGTQVTFNAAAGQGISGLTSGTQYYAFNVVDPNYVSGGSIVLSTTNKLTTNSAGVTGVALNVVQTLTTTSGTPFVFDIVETDAAAAVLTLSPDPGNSGAAPTLQIGTPLRYTSGFESATNSLISGTTYYAVVIDNSNPNAIKVALCSTAAGATATDSSGENVPTGVLDLLGGIDLGTVSTAFMSGTSSTLTPTGTSGIAIQANLTSQDVFVVDSAIGSEPKLKDLLTNGNFTAGTGVTATSWRNVFGNITNWGTPSGGGSGESPFGSVLAEAEGPQGTTNSNFSISGSVMFADITNSAVAEVGPDAVLKSAQNLSVQSTLVEESHNQDEATLSKPDGVKGGTSVATSFVIAILINTAHSYVDSNAHLDAAGALAVNSGILYPWAGQLADPEGGIAGFFSQQVSSGFTNALATLFNGKLGLDSVLVNSWANAGAKTATASSGSSSANSIAVSVDFVEPINDDEAQIFAGAQINQDPTYQNAGQSVSVTANTNVQQTNFAGNVYLDLSPDNIAKTTRQGGIVNNLGTSIFAPIQASKGAYGAAVGIMLQTNTTIAAIGNPDPSGTAAATATAVNFGSGATQSLSKDSAAGESGNQLVLGADGNNGLEVNANTYVFNLELSQSGADSQGTGVTGSLSLMANGGNSTATAGPDSSDGGNTTTAHIAPGVKIKSDPNTFGDVNVSATDNQVLVLLSGGVLVAKNTGVGVAAVVDTVDRNTEALIGADENAAPGAASAYIVGGNLGVTAANTGALFGAALSATAMSQYSAPPAGDPQAVDPGAGVQGDALAQGGNPQAGSGGWAVSGDAVVFDINITTIAGINDAGTFQVGGNTAVSSSNSTWIAQAAGAGTFASQGQSVGIAGAFVILSLSGNDDAYVANTASLVTTGLTVSATRGTTGSANVYELAIGGSSAPAGNAKSVAGSASIVNITGRTNAWLSNVHATLAADSSITATDASWDIAAAGTYSASGGSWGFGAGVAYSDVTSPVNAIVTGSSITQTDGSLAISATDSIVLITAAAGLSTASGQSGVAVAAMVAVSLLTCPVAATMTGGRYDNQSKSASGGNLSLTAEDEPVVGSGAGALASSGNNTGVGVAISVSQIHDDNFATISGTTINIPGTLTLGSVSSAPSSGVPPIANTNLLGGTSHAIYSVAIGGAKAGSSGFAVAGAVTFNTLDNSNTASIADSATVTTGGAVSVTATDASDIFAANGSIALSQSKSIGAALANNSITNVTTATITGSTVTSGSSVTVLATEESSIISGAIGGANAASFALGGAIAHNVLNNTVSATASNSTIIAGGTVEFSASDTPSILSITGGVAFSGSAQSATTIGAAIVANSITDSVTASLADSNVSTTSGNIEVLAATNPSLSAYTIGGTINGQGTAISGSIAYTALAFTTTASITGTSADTVRASGTVAVSAYENLASDTVSGNLGFAGNGTAFGLASSTVTTGDTTKATIGAGVNVLGQGNSSDTFTSSDANGDPASETVSGVAVTAVAFQAIVNVAAGAQGGSSNGIAGSSTVEVLNETTTATIAAGAVINPLNPTFPASASQGVTVYSSSASDFDDVAGAATYGSKGGFGAGVDVGVITKNTQASIGDGTSAATGAVLNAAGNIRVNAQSNENVLSVGGAIGIGGSTGVAGAVGIYTVNPTTTADIGAYTQATANANIQVAANDQDDLSLIAGALSVSGSNGFGASVAVPVINKTTKAWIGFNANVNALAKSPANAITADTGQFTVNSSTPSTFPTSAVNTGANTITLGYNPGLTTGDAVVYNAAEKSSIGGLTSGQTYYVIVTASSPTSETIKLASSVQDADAGNALALTSTGNDGQSLMALGTPNPAAAASSTLPDLAGLTNPAITTADTSSMTGLAVTATSSDTVNQWVVSGAGAANAAVPISASVNVSHATTEAFIDSGAQVNQLAGAGAGQSVLVAAGSNYRHIGVGGAVAGAGNVAVGAGVDVASISLTTEAYINEGATVSAVDDVSVIAQAQETLYSIAVGGAFSGKVALAGGVSVVTINNTTLAFIGNQDANELNPAATDVQAGNNILVASSDTTTIHTVNPGVGIGVGAAGIGISVTVVSVTKNTDAYLSDGAQVTGFANGTDTMATLKNNAADPFATQQSQGVAVQATSTESITTTAVAGGGGFVAGVAGAVTVVTVHSSTLAYINAALVNLAAGTAGANQSISVGAANETTLDARVPVSAALGGAGVAGAVTVGLVDNLTQAYIGDQALVQARDNVDVYALSSKTISSFTLGLGGGLAGLAASVAVFTLGAALSSDATNNLSGANDTSAAGTVSNATSTSNITSALNGFEAAPNSQDSVATTGSTQTSGNSADVLSNVTTAQNTITSDASNSAASDLNATTAPESGTFAYIGSNAMVTASNGNVDVEALESVGETHGAGEISAGIGAAGAAILVINVTSNTRAYVDQNAIVSAGAALTVNAGLTENTQINAWAGANLSGVVTATAQFAEITDNSTQSASINNGAGIPSAQSVTVSASANRTLNSTAVDYASISGAVTGGASVALATASGNTNADLGNSVRIGQVPGKTVGSVTVSAADTTNATADESALTAGIVASIAGNVAKANVNPTVTTSVGDGSAITTPGELSLQAFETPQANATASGVNAGAVAVGGSFATANVTPTVSSVLGGSSGVTANAGSVSIQASVLLPSAGTTATASGSGSDGGLVGVNVSDTNATATSGVTSSVAAGSTLTVGGDVTIDASNFTNQSAASNNVGIGLFAVGANPSSASSNNTTTAALGAGVTLTAQSLTIQADGNDTNGASSNGGNGGVIAFNSNSATTTTTSKTTASIADPTSTAKTSIAVGTLSINATQDQTFNAQASSASAGVVGISGANVVNTASPTVATIVGNNVNVTAGAINATAKSTVNKPALANGTSNVVSGSGGVAANPSGGSTSIVGSSSSPASTTVQIGDHSNLTAVSGPNGPGNIVMAASNSIDGTDLATLTAGGAIARAAATSVINAWTTAEVVIGASNITSAGATTLASQTNANISTTANAKAYGLAGAPQGTSQSNLTASNLIHLLNGSNVRANGTIALFAGEDSSGEFDSSTVQAATNLINGTVFGSGSPTANANLTQTTQVLIDKGASVVGAGSIELNADKGTTVAIGNGSSISSFANGAAAPTPVGPESSDSAIAYGVTTGTGTVTNDVGVTVNGTVQDGNNSNVSLTINQQLQSVGDAPVARPNFDTDSGQVYINSGPSNTFSGADVPQLFAFYTTQTANYVTPLIFQVSNGVYTLAAIGQSFQAIGKAGQTVFTAPINLIAGTLSSSNQYVFGFSDRDVATGASAGNVVTQSTTPGTIPFSSSGTSDWLNTTSATFSASTELNVGQTFSSGGSATYSLQTGRTYAAQLYLNGAYLISVGDNPAPLANNQTVNYDSSQGQVYINDQTFGGTFVPQQFSYYAGNTTNYVTPLLFQVVNGKYTLAAVGASYLATNAGVNSIPINWIEGQQNISAGNTYVFGFTDRQLSAGSGNSVNTVAATSGTIPYQTSSTGDWLYTSPGSNFASTSSLSLGQAFSTSSSSGIVQLNAGRSYGALLDLEGDKFLPGATSSTYFPGITYTSSPAGIAPTVSAQNLATSIANQVATLQTLAAQYPAGSQAQAGFIAQINQLEAEQAQILGQSNLPAGYLAGNLPEGVIDLPDITAGAGDISVVGDYFNGAGTVASPGNASITITNNSPYSLNVNDLTIPTTGGLISFNNLTVTSQTALNALNPSNKKASFQAYTTAAGSPPPSITVLNTFNPANGFSPNTNLGLNVNEFLTPSLNIDGAVTVPGTFTATNIAGTIDVLGNISAATVKITAGAGFSITTSGEFDTGGSPIQQWNTQAENDDEAAASSFPSSGTEGFSNFVPGTVPSGTTTGSVISNGSIYITAKTLNLNGLVQSGQANPTVTIKDVAVGNTPSADENSLDTDLGQVYINNQEFIATGQPEFIGFNAASTTNEITPLLFVVRDETYTLAAVGESIRPSQVGMNFAPFTIIEGGVSSGLTYVFGFTDRDVVSASHGALTTVSSTGGTIPFSTSISGDWSYTTVGSNWAANQALAIGQTFGGAGIEINPGRSYGAFLELGTNGSSASGRGFAVGPWYQQYYSQMSSQNPDLPSSFNLAYDFSTGTPVPVAVFNAATGQLQLNSIQAAGAGFIQLTGQIISTGNGQITALDGYSNISITNQTNYPLVVQTLDTGGTNGITGRVVIVDTSREGYTPSGPAPLTTTYTNDRAQGTVQETTNFQLLGTLTDDVPGWLRDGFAPDSDGPTSFDTLDTFSGTQLPIALDYYAEATNVSITPLLFVVNDGIYTLVAKGQSFQPTQANAINCAPLNWVQGTSSLDPSQTYVFGFKQNVGSDGLATSAAIPLTAPSSGGGWATLYDDLPVGGSYNPQDLGNFWAPIRTYAASIQFAGTTTSNAAGTATYQPTLNDRFVWTTGQSGATQTTYVYSKTVSTNFFNNIGNLFDSGAFGTLTSDENLQSQTTTVTSPDTPISEGGYLSNVGSIAANPTGYLFTSSETPAGPTAVVYTGPVSTSQSGNFFAGYDTTANQTVIKQSATTYVYTHSVKADYAIPISFIGSAQGQITISTPGDLILNNSLSSAGGTTSLTSGGSIQMLGTSPINAATLILSAQTGIGANGPIETSINGGTLLATTASGDIAINENFGSVGVAGVYTGSGNVSLTARESISVAPIPTGKSSPVPAGTVSGTTISLTSQAGTIGTAAEPLLVRNGQTRYQGGLSAQASGDINIVEPQGDLLATSIVSTKGNVTLTAPAGRILDNLPTIPVDPLAASNPSNQPAYWSSLSLLGSAAQTQAADNVTSYEQQQNQDYQTYWLTYRLTGYNSQGKPTFSSSLPSNYQYQFSSQQTQALQSEGYTTAQISALAAAKTQQAFQLNALFGSGTYNPNFNYTVSASQAQQLQSGAVWQQPQLQFPIPVGALTNSGSNPGNAEAANISGHNVTLTASGSVGFGSGQVSISADATSLTPAQQAAIANANAHSITVNGSTLIINLADSLDIAASGLVNINSGGSIALASTTPLQVGNVQAKGAVSLVSDAGISFSGLPSITGNGVSLAALNGSIGAASGPPVPVYINAGAGDVTLNASQNVGITSPTLTGFGGGWTANSNPTNVAMSVTAGSATLTDSNPTAEARSLWYNGPVATGSFTVNFTYTNSSKSSYGGVAFVMQSGTAGSTNSLGAAGNNGTGLGYLGLGNSVAYEISNFNGNSNDQNFTAGTGFAASGSTGIYNATSPVNMASGNAIQVTLTYNAGTGTLVELLKDSVTGASYTHTFTGIDLAALLGPTAIIGFTGADGSGSANAVQTISNFSMTEGAADAKGYALQGNNVNVNAGQNVNLTGNSAANLQTTGTSITGFTGLASGNATVNGNPDSDVPYVNTGLGALVLTDAPSNEAHSIWYGTPVSTGSFTLTFMYESNPPGSQTAYQVDSGMTLVLQAGGVGSTASLGSNGAGLGYAGITAPSMAYEININNGPANGTGTETVGTNLVTNGTTGNYHSTGSVNVNDGNKIVVTLTYDASAHTLTESLKSATNPAATYSHTYTGIDLDALLGPTAILGFTGSTGTYGSVQLISNFSYSGAPLPSGINLTAGNTINVTGNIGGMLNASAPNGIVLDQKTGSLSIGTVATSAPTSAVTITAAGSILDGTGGHGPNLSGPVISLTSQIGSIGTPTAPLQLGSRAGVAGLTTTAPKGTINIKRPVSLSQPNNSLPTPTPTPAPLPRAPLPNAAYPTPASRGAFVTTLFSELSSPDQVPKPASVRHWTRRMVNSTPRKAALAIYRKVDRQNGDQSTTVPFATAFRAAEEAGEAARKARARNDSQLIVGKPKPRGV